MIKSILKTAKMLIIPAVASLFFILLFLFLTVYQRGEGRVYNLLLGIKPAVKEQPEILILEIDEPAIAQVGTWPWSRDIVADGLILLREFNAGYTVFDIEYIDRSPRGVDSRYLEETIPALFSEQFSSLKDNTTGLFNAIAEGYIPVRDAADYVADLSSLIDSIENRQIEAVSRIAKNNDAYLGKAARLNGSAFFTVNLHESDVQLITVNEEIIGYVEDHLSVPLVNNNRNGKNSFFKAKTMQPTILPILTMGAGAGFPNVYVDPDGVRRRIDILSEYNGQYYPQLSVAPLLNYLGEPELSLSGKRLTLKDAKMPDGSERNVAIPLTSDGRMLINWPPKTFQDSFRHLSYNKLVVHDKYMENLASNLEIMEQAGYLSFYQGDTSPLEYYRYAEALKADILNGDRDPSEMDDYRRIRDMFMEETGSFLDGTAEQNLLEQIDALLSSPDLDEATKASYREIRDQAVSFFAAVKSDYDNLASLRGELDKEIGGSFIIIGLTGIGTTDIGVNPFEEAYMNVGTHAAVANTILTGDFITELPNYIVILLTIALSFGLTFLIRKQSPRNSIIIGLSAVIVTAGMGAALFALFRIYLPLLTPLVTLFFTTLSVSIVKFVVSEKEKSFLRNAFSRYLSSDVISQIIQDPDKLNLGGEKKILSAIFTDVQGFSSLSENLDPQQLVNLLNQYLSAMSDIILEQKGTIDKYEGDAIISFFGAPIDLEDHPYRACLSAIKMKRVERELNEKFLKDKIAPVPLLTRIGINTGEMVVGNMGTPRKMDYTIMGSSVNLASRLEGVNKQYGTWVLASENAVMKSKGDFVTRKLDRVRVVGIQTPVRLFELHEEKHMAGKDLLEGLEIFHSGLDAFEGKDWAKAEKFFNDALKLLPNDGPSDIYLKRCQKYKKTPPMENWDGVFNLSVK